MGRFLYGLRSIRGSTVEGAVTATLALLLFAGVRVRATDAFGTTFFLTDDIEEGTCYEKKQYADNSIIDQLYGSYLLSGGSVSESIFRFHGLLCTNGERRVDRNDCACDCPADDGHPDFSEASAREERSKEENEEGQRVANGEL